MKVLLLSFLGLALTVTHAIQLNEVIRQHAETLKSGQISSALLEALGSGDVDSLASIYKTVDETLIPQLKGQVAAKQTSLDKLYGILSNCATTKKTCDSEADVLEGNLGTATDALKNAKLRLKEAETWKTDSCPASVTFTGEDGTDEKETAVERMNNMQKDLDKALTEYNAAFKAVNVATKALESSTKAFETKSSGCKASCNTCDGTARKAYNTEVAEARKLEAGQKMDLETYELFKCIALAKGDKRGSVLDKCRTEKVDTSSISYTIKEASAINCNGMPGFAKVGQGICNPYGIRVYEGDGDNEGTKEQRIQRCAKGCFEKKTALGYGPWSARGDALGFALKTTGRCYCQHEKLKSCKKNYLDYGAYEFKDSDAEPDAEKPEPEGKLYKPEGGVPGFAQVGKGLCDPEGVRVYEGNADNGGTTQEQRIKRCAKACFQKKTALGYGPWSAQGDARGFGLPLGAANEGRCYCNHKKFSSCTHAHDVYVSFDFK